MVVDHRGEEVVRRADGVYIPGEVEVYVLHRDDLRVSAARGAALEPEHGTERRLAHGDDGTLSDTAQCVRKPDGGGGLALARRGGRYRRDEDELALRCALRRVFEKVQRDLRLIAPVLFEIFFIYARERGDLPNRAHRARLRDLYVRFH